MGIKSVVTLRKHRLLCDGARSSRAWKDTKAAKCPWEGWTGSFGVPGRGTAELKAGVVAGVWVWQLCHGVGWDVGQKEQRRFGFWSRWEASSNASRQEVGKRMSWTLLCVFSASQLPLCASVPSVCVSSEFSPSPLFAPCDLLSPLCCLIAPSLFLFALLSLLPLSVTQLAPVSLCLFALSLPYLLSASVPSAPPLCSPGPPAPSPVSLCPRPRLPPLSQG